MALENLWLFFYRLSSSDPAERFHVNLCCIHLLYEFSAIDYKGQFDYYAQTCFREAGRKCLCKEYAWHCATFSQRCIRVGNSQLELEVHRT